jgi:exodeoxyribonuclease V alpha subunit
LVEVRNNGGALVEFGGQTYQVNPERVIANAFTLAYALTIHRAQGSEFPIVVVVMDRSAHIMLARRLLYTAVSRARQTVAIVGQPQAVATAVERHDTRRRHTALGPLLVAELTTRSARAAQAVETAELAAEAF